MDYFCGLTILVIGCTINLVDTRTLSATHGLYKRKEVLLSIRVDVRKFTKIEKASIKTGDFSLFVGDNNSGIRI